MEGGFFWIKGLTSDCNHPQAARGNPTPYPQLVDLEADPQKVQPAWLPRRSALRVPRIPWQCQHLK